MPNWKVEAGAAVVTGSIGFVSRAAVIPDLAGAFNPNVNSVDAGFMTGSAGSVEAEVEAEVEAGGPGRAA